MKPVNPMKSVPVEKWEKEFDEKFGDNLSLDGPFDKSYAKLVLAPALKDFISQAIQAAQSEAFTAGQQSVCAHSMWKKETVEGGKKCTGCGMVANEFPMVGSIINKHQ